MKRAQAAVGQSASQPEDVETWDAVVPERNIPVRLYRAREAKGVLPAFIMYVIRFLSAVSELRLRVDASYHGGGWVIGDLLSEDRTARMVSRETGCLVINVDYRL
jgi:acetyl esterase/lipase